MPITNWNDLRVLLAVARGGTLAGAARRLAVDGTTVARRLAALQDAAGARLVERLADGRLQLTPAGEAAVRSAEAMEREVGALNAEVAGADALVAGTVRLTAVPLLVNRLLVPAIGPLLAAHPGLEVELNGEARNLSLTRREADLALRLARPQAGGRRIKTRRIARLAYAAYVAADGTTAAEGLPWVSYDDALAHLPQARWMAQAAGAGRGRLASLRIGDAEAAVEAVAAGLGRSLLPCLIADRDPRLCRVSTEGHAVPPTREAWLLVHAELAPLARVAAVTAWLEEVFARPGGPN